MSKPAKVVVLVGSLRKDSFNRKAARAIEALAPSNLSFEHVEIGELPLYNQDFDALDPQPAPYAAFRDRIKAADAVLFVTPEYNRSIPGALKNAVDVGSRPWGHSVFKGKPAAIVSVSPGGIGGFGASNHLRQAVTFLDMPLLNQPEMYIGGAGDLFAADGSLKREDTKEFFTAFGAAFAAWIEKTRA